MKSWDSQPDLLATPGPVVLVVRDNGDLVRRCEQALKALPSIRLCSCVAGELREVVGALQPALAVVSNGVQVPELTGVPLLRVRNDERREPLRVRITDAIRGALIK